MLKLTANSIHLTVEYERINNNLSATEKLYLIKRCGAILPRSRNPRASHEEYLWRFRPNLEDGSVKNQEAQLSEKLCNHWHHTEHPPPLGLPHVYQFLLTYVLYIWQFLLTYIFSWLSTEKLAAAIGRRHWPICWARIVRCGGRYDPQLVKRSSEWVSEL